uniref:Integrase catalytic domain-containing protein n=1 Tax=Lactuca sativa TaxID=4236 RepID=A0A9R1WR41_LACSA|nr:hypothetical protein LSAT_V11C900461290 [Lactuca sativa]
MNRYLHVYLMRSKDEAFDAFKRYKAEIENQLERHIKILRLDRGGKYFNQEFDTFCEENGIKHERTSLYTPQHNGLAERKNQTLCKMVLSCNPEMWNSLRTSFLGMKKTPVIQDLQEPMGSSRARIDKSFGDDLYSYLVEETQEKVTREVIFTNNLDDDPKTFIEAMTSRDAPLWREAINDEMDSIMGNGTWELADLPKGRRHIGSKWIFNRKYHPDGSIFAYKERLVAKGYRQRERTIILIPMPRLLGLVLLELS